MGEALEWVAGYFVVGFVVVAACAWFGLWRKFDEDGNREMAPMLFATIWPLTGTVILVALAYGYVVRPADEALRRFCERFGAPRPSQGDEQ